MEHTKESKSKIRSARLGKRFSDQTKSKMSVSHTGKTHSEETKRKISETILRKKSTAIINDPWSFTN
jgi:hypothetical protein